MRLTRAELYVAGGVIFAVIAALVKGLIWLFG